MRNVLVLSAITALISLASTAHAEVRYLAADDSKESALCVSAAVDRHHQFSNKVEVSGIPYKTVAAKLDCNGINVALFSAQAGNTKTAQHLARYSPTRGQVDIREANTDAGKTQPSVAARAGDIVIRVKGE